MPLPRAMFLCLGILLITAGGIMVLCGGVPYQLFGVGAFMGLGGMGLLVSGLCMAMKNLQVAVPGHFLLHPRTGTRFSPQQALAIQRRLDRIRREMSEDSVSRNPDPEPSLPSTPPPWTMEPPPSYDTVMKSQEQSQERIQEQIQERIQEQIQERIQEQIQERIQEQSEEQQRQTGLHMPSII